MRNNTQLPFSFQKRADYHRDPKPKPGAFSRNIKGICVTYGHPTQRVKKYDALGVKLPVPFCLTCKRVGLGHVEVKELPEALRPWKIIRARGDYNGYYSIRFACQGCGSRYSNFSTFGSL